MSTQGTELKEWYIYLGNQKQGPYSLAEIRSKIQQSNDEGRIYPETQIWKKGMEKWVKAQSAHEFKSLFNKPHQSNHLDNNSSSNEPVFEDVELSALIEVRPDDLDDRTSAIDATELKRAQKEAAMVLKQGKKAEKSSLIYQAPAAPGRTKLLAILVFIGLILGLLGALKIGIIPVQILGSPTPKWLNTFVSPIPPIDDISSEAYVSLQLAVRADLKKEGPQIRIALSPTSPEHPYFYMATNLPNDVALRFYIQSIPGKVLSEKPIEILFPILITDRLMKTRSLALIDGSKLPAGEYRFFIVDDEQQPSPNTKNILSPLPEIANLPSPIPSGRKIAYSTQFFLGTLNPSEFQIKLQELAATIKKRDLDEIQQLSHINDFIENEVTRLLNFSEKHAKTLNRVSVKKDWALLLQDFRQHHPATNWTGNSFPTLFQIAQLVWKESERLYNFQNEKIELSVNGNALRESISTESSKLRQTIVEFRAKLVELAKARSQ